MLYISTDDLKPGMILARDIDLGVNIFPLVAKGQALSGTLINKMKDKGIKGVYVKSKLTGDIVIEDVVDKKTQNKITVNIKKIFEEFSRTTMITTDNLKVVGEMSKSLVSSILSRDEVVINLTSLKDYDNYTYTHSLSVAILSVTIGIKLGYNEDVLIDLATCGLLHDIGKMSVPLEIIKKPDKLDDTEYAIMQKHPGEAFVHLEKSNIFSRPILRGIESHHEKYDGTGYPHGQKGQQIPLYARVLAVADVYDALTSDRPYRKAWYPNETIEYMMGCANTHFDYDILLAFLKSVAAYPVGMLVDLSDGRKAMVVKNYSENSLRPLVRPLSENGVCMPDIDLLNDPHCANLTILGRCQDHMNIDLAVLGDNEYDDIAN